jgi:hypothetical protein
MNSWRLGLLAAAAGVMFGQAAPEAVKLGTLTVQGSLRTRIEAWDWFQGDGDNQYALSGSLLRIGFSQQRESLDWQLELAAPILLGLPDNAVAPGAQGAMGMGANYFTANNRSRYAGMIFAKQGFVRFKNLFGSKSQSLRIGRFEWVDGSEVAPKNATLAALKRDRITQRLIGHFGFTHVGRSLDGFHYVYNRPKTNVTWIGAFPTRGVFQVDGWGDMRTAFSYASVTRQVNGKKNTAEWRLLALYYHDWRHILKTDNRALATRRADLANIRIGTFGGHYLHTTETACGPLDFLLWGVMQTGKWGVQDHRAGAMAIEAGWQPKAMPKLKPWLRGGYFHGSGDGNPADQKHNTFFQVLPTPRPYARFPFFNLMNNEDIHGSLALRPHKAVVVKTEFHALRLADRNDQWLVGGGAFQPWTFGYVGRAANGARSLANLYDLSADYTINKNFVLGGYYGYAQGRSVMETIYPKGKNGSLFYVELTYRF